MAKGCRISLASRLRGVTIPIVVSMACLAPAACSSDVKPTMPPGQAPLAEFWRPPTDIASQDLFYGPWGRALAPDAATTYRFVRPKTTGVNPGMAVLDLQGREWSVKQRSHDRRSPEGPIEVVLSRVLSAVGYHQPPVYYLPTFQLADTFGTRLEPGGRFRLVPPELKEQGSWSWQENPFVGTRPYQGLLVILMMFNSSDLKNSNNSLYEYRAERRAPERWYVVRDLGTALGNTARIRAVRGDPEQFRLLPFVTGVEAGFVQFGAYAGLHQELVRGRITVDDVQWASALLGQLSEAQWHDAFRAGGFDRPVATQFITRLRAKVSEGQALLRTAE